MLLSKEEKIAVLLLRIEKVRLLTLFGAYKNYEVGEKKIRKMKGKIEKLGGDSSLKISIE